MRKRYIKVYIVQSRKDSGEEWAIDGIFESLQEANARRLLLLDLPDQKMSKLRVLDLRVTAPDTNGKDE
jgi:hypothetical protein